MKRVTTRDKDAIVTNRSFVWGWWLSLKLKDRLDRSFADKFRVSSERDKAISHEETEYGHS